MIAGIDQSPQFEHGKCRSIHLGTLFAQLVTTTKFGLEFSIKGGFISLSPDDAILWRQYALSRKVCEPNCPRRIHGQPPCSSCMQRKLRARQRIASVAA